MSKRYCCLCKNYSDSVLLKFPEDPELLQKWCEATGVAPESAQESKARICMIHFDEDQWVDGISKQKKPYKILKIDAVPNAYVGEDALIVDNNATVPPETKSKHFRCAICNKQSLVNQGVGIFTKRDSYTDFGAALAYLLKMTSRGVSSRYCCVDCSEEVYACFGNVVKINVSTSITKKVNERAAEERLKFKVDGNIPEKNQNLLPTIAQIKSAGKFPEKLPCNTCSQHLVSYKEYTEHMTNHFFDNKDVFNQSAAVVQTDEVEIDMGLPSIDEDEFIVLPSKSKRRKKEPKLKKDPLGDHELLLPNDLDLILEDNIKLEASGQITEDGFIIEKLDDPDENQDEEMIEEHLEEDEEASETDSEDELAFERKPKSRKNVPGGTVCHICGKSLKNQASFNAHMKLHRYGQVVSSSESSEPWDCEICGATLKHHMSYKQHMMRVHSAFKPNAKVCDYCGQLRGNLTQHKKTCRQALEKGRQSTSSTCGVCGKIFASRYMSKHLKLHAIEEDIAKNGPSAVSKYVQHCEICSKKTYNIQLHMSKYHKDSLNPEDPLPTDLQNHDCPHCDAHFEQRPLLVYHLILKHNMDPKQLPRRGRQGVRDRWKCHVCGVEFKNYGTIKKHTHQEHNGVGINLACETCGKRYNTIEALREHINVKHINYYPFHCFPCDKHFVSEHTYKNHLEYYCRMHGVGPGTSKKKQRTTEPNESVYELQKLENEQYEYDGETFEVDASQLPLLDMSEVSDTDASNVRVYVPNDNMVVVYEEV